MFSSVSVKSERSKVTCRTSVRKKHQLQEGISCAVHYNIALFIQCGTFDVT